MRPYVRTEERRIMQRLMERRERETEHKSPDWVAAYWRQVAR
jgi:hypothetical protein